MSEESLKTPVKSTVSVLIGQASETSSAGSISIAHRIYYSRYHISAAKYACERLKNIEQKNSFFDHLSLDVDVYQEYRHLTFLSITAAAAYREALINEFFADASDGISTYLNTLSRETLSELQTYWGNQSSFISTFKKYDEALEICNCLPNEASNILELDAKLVTDLRNKILHAKPESIDCNDDHELEKILSGKFELCPFTKNYGLPFFPDKCFGSSFSNWAIKSIERYVESFCEKVGFGLI